MSNQNDGNEESRAAPPLASVAKQLHVSVGDHLSKHATDLERIYTRLQPYHAAILLDEDTAFALVFCPA